MAIQVIGANCSLGEAVVDKLLSLDIDVIAKEESHYVRNKSLLEFSTAKLLEEGQGYSISFNGDEADLIIGKNLIIRDLIPTRADRWLPEEFQDWIAGNDSNYSSRYWLSIIDAANAIATIAKNHVKVENIVMCGRRRWLNEDTKAEFEMLWERTTQGQSGKFTADVLFGHEIAGMEAIPIVIIDDERPNLEPLHELMLELSGEGWRPMIPFRTALMSLIAGLIE